jgi:protoporphyrinogen oxidase
MRIGIIGGGLMGLALAERLGSAGHRVTVYERAEQPGGLATWHDFGAFTWDRFYHVILPSDTALVEFMRRIGLGEGCAGGPTQTGFYVDRAFHPLSSGLDFLRFRCSASGASSASPRRSSIARGSATGSGSRA